jgi:uncharacterized membrane protein
MQLLRRVPQIVLGAALLFTGKGHLTTSREAFQAQVPKVFGDYADAVVLISGVVELLLGLGLIVLWKYRVQMGLLAATFFVAVFWGNISQYINHVDAFGLDTDTKRFVRLLFQPALVAWALVSTGSWSTLRKSYSK